MVVMGSKLRFVSIKLRRSVQFNAGLISDGFTLWTGYTIKQFTGNIRIEFDHITATESE